MEFYLSGVMSVVVPFFKTFSLSFVMCDLKVHETSTGNTTEPWERNLQHMHIALTVSCLQQQLFS